MQPETPKDSLYRRLIDGCLLNKRHCQRQLYEILSGKMYAVCMRYCSNQDTAQDILQEGWIKVFSNLEKYREAGSFEGWVRRIFINTAVEHYRKESRLYPVSDNEAALERIPTVDFQEDNLEVEGLMNMVQNLSAGYRTVFNLYVIEGYSHKEISEMLKISEGTSKSQLARARYILQKQIQEAQRVRIPHVAQFGK